MKNVIFLLFVSLFMGCQKFSVFEVDPAVMPYYQQFVKDGSERGKDVSTDNLIIKFGDVPSSRVVAFCTTDSREGLSLKGRRHSETPMVVLNPFWWERSNDVQRQETITHELGHCLFKYGHDDSRGPDGYLNSIMSSFSISRVQYSVYVKNIDGYLDQFFGVTSYYRGVKRKSNNTDLASKTWVSNIDGCDGRESTNEDVELVQKTIEKIREEK